jgi:hypothetical protein
MPLQQPHDMLTELPLNRNPYLQQHHMLKGQTAQLSTGATAATLRLWLHASG